MLKTVLRNIAFVLWKKRIEKTATNNPRMRPFRKLEEWPPSKGYSLCKIVTLGQKLKMQTRILKKFLQEIAVVLCEKRLEKTANIRKMILFSKLAKMATKQGL